MAENSENNVANPLEVESKPKNKKIAMIVVIAIAVLAVLGVVIYLVLDGMGVVGKKGIKKIEQLADYKSFTYDSFDKTVTDDDVKDYYKEMTDYYIQSGYKVYEEDKEHEGDTVAKGDTVNIAFKGFIDGEAFQGGESESYDLIIGSNSFIEGFEDGLIGAKKGDTLDVKTKFPNPYPNNPDLSGKEAIFTVTIHYFAKEVKLTTDNAYEKIFNFKSVDEIYTELKKYLQEEAISNEKEYIEEQKGEYLSYIIDNTKFDDLTKEADEFYKNYYEAMEKMASDNNLTMEKIANQYGYKTVEEFRNSLKEQSTDEVKKNLVLEKIAKDENIVLSDEKYNEYSKDIIKEAGYGTVEEYASTYDGYYGKDMYKLYVTNLYVLDVLFEKYAKDSGVVATPAAK